ncbi:MAG TPA: carboxypeptidase-like regulatory domain-containing protein, partial [bacterium]|nr:carboxypeptidase-like regulatory domain-containing protein [bacterium]
TVRVQLVDSDGKKVAYANVYFADGDFAGAFTNDSGLAIIRTHIAGERHLTASLIGYDTEVKKIKVPHAQTMHVTMHEKSVELGELVIEASAYGGGEGKVAVSKIDVYTTPGGAADVFQSVKVLPGVTQTDETAAVPVRGGSPSENLILFNGATLAHPYHGENTAGNGFFTIVKTAVIRKLYFSSGGFSVRYGNALSGVLDIETDNHVAQNRVALDANLVSVGGGLQRQIIPNTLSAQVYADHTSTALLFKMNKPAFDVVRDPVTSNVTGIVNYNYRPSGQIQAMILESRDAQTFDLTLQSNSQRYALETGNRVMSLQWSELFNPQWTSKASWSYSMYRNDWTFGDWRRANREYNIKWRWDHHYALLNRTILSFGGEAYGDFYRFDYILPLRRGEYYNGADSVALQGNHHATVVAAYAEVQQKITRRWSAQIGFRTDYQTLSQNQVYDIRGSVVHEFAANSFLRFSAGTFHQFPHITMYDKTIGNPDLKAMRARHAVVGWEKNAATYQLKIESYYKWYDHLPLSDEDKNYVSQGRGYARGLDFFLKGGFAKTSGWFSYSFIQTRRKEMQIQTMRPSLYDITHNISLIVKQNLGRNFELASTLRYATGRPYTPVTAGQYDPVRGIWQPVYAADYSDRFPDFKRLDARLSKFFILGPQKHVVLYVEALNLLGIRNILDYSYSEDFSERHSVPSYFSNRTVVMGFSLSL